MPELPEVETVRRGSEQHLVGRRVRAVELRRHDLRWPIPVAAVEDLRGRRCTAVRRRAKYLLLCFDGPGQPIALIHLGMSGCLFVDTVSTPAWETHEHWRLQFGGRLLRYVDARRFGALDVVAAADLATHPRLRQLGPEPFSAEFATDYVHLHSRRHKVATKVWLMNAKYVVGIGNIYASEACFHAGVRPRRAAGRLRHSDCERLVAAVREVLQAAIDAGGTTLRDYATLDRDSGYFQRELAVYGRSGEACEVCGTTIKRAILAQRSTYWCPHCQV